LRKERRFPHAGQAADSRLVKKRHFVDPFYTKKNASSFYQDRLGTNIGKTHSNKECGVSFLRVPKVASCDVKHMLYKRDRPFHPARLVRSPSFFLFLRSFFQTEKRSHLPRQARDKQTQEHCCQNKTPKRDCCVLRVQGLLLSDGHASTVPRQLGLTRSKGIFWIATRSEMVGEWQHAGSLYRFVQGAAWDNGPQADKGKKKKTACVLCPLF
jgi:hypothetical protein